MNYRTTDSNRPKLNKTHQVWTHQSRLLELAKLAHQNLASSCQLHRPWDLLYGSSSRSPNLATMLSIGYGIRFSQGDLDHRQSYGVPFWNNQCWMGLAWGDSAMLKSTRALATRFARTKSMLLIINMLSCRTDTELVDSRKHGEGGPMS